MKRTAMIMSRKFSEIPSEKFAEFHKTFNGEGDWWQDCAKCGGKCEKNKIGSLMPGEKKFIAGSGRERSSIDTIKTPFGDVEVLRLDRECPFLIDFHCELGAEKVVMCDVYPIIFEVSETSVRFFLDTGCPLCRNMKAVKYFEEVGIPALKKLNVPLSWWRAVELFDHYDFDYKILAKLPRINGRGVFTLEQILAARKW